MRPILRKKRVISTFCSTNGFVNVSHESFATISTLKIESFKIIATWFFSFPKVVFLNFAKINIVDSIIGVYEISQLFCLGG